MSIKEEHSYPAFPADVAVEVNDLWSHLVAGDYSPPSLPSPSQLKTLFEVAYLAGMETDEARPLKFMICCTPNAIPIRRRGNGPVESWEFARERPYNVQEIRRLAATTDFDASAIWVQFFANRSERLTIRGLVNLGRSWSVARNAFAYHYAPLPHALIVRVGSPGRLTIYQGDYCIAKLASGKLEVGATRMASMDLLGISRLLEEGRDALRGVIDEPRKEDPKQWHEFEYMAYVNCILAIVNTMQLAGHGGALIIKSLDCDLAKGELVRTKYGLKEGSENLKNRFVEFMNSRHKYGEMIWLSEWQKDAAPGQEEIELASIPIRELEQNLARACTFVGGLAGADGAVVLRTDLTVEGFGTEIVLDKVKRAKAYEINEPFRDEDRRELDSEQLGMRHRSAIRLCATTPNLAAFVVSQDGGVSLVWNKTGDVCLMQGITTTNLNMVLA